MFRAVLRAVATLLVLLAVTACAAPTKLNHVLSAQITPDNFKELVEDLSRTSGPLLERLFLLEFDHEGRLSNRIELAKAIAYVRAKQPTRVIVLSFGWNYDKSEAEEAYVEYVVEYLAHIKKRIPGATDEKILANSVILAVSWDSNSAGLRRFLTDLVPAPELAGLVASPFDTLAFPLTFWTKAALADRIGFGALKDALETFVDLGYTEPSKPDIYLVGHSFGTRVLSGLAQTRLGFFKVTDPFRHRDRVRGAVFIQPALSRNNLPNPDGLEQYPIVVTQSRHDHANGFLFPVGNLPLNTYTATGIEAFFERSSRQPAWQRFLTSLVRIPWGLVWSALALPVNYVWTQADEITTRRLDWIPDTLAQLPVVEVPVEAVDRLAFDGTRGWGRRHKGALSLGSIHESAARVTMPKLGEWGRPTVHSLDCFLKATGGSDLRGSPGRPKPVWRFHDPVVYLDAAGVLSRSFYGPDLEEALVDHTLGWIDPIGSHSRWEPEEPRPPLSGRRTKDRPPHEPLVFDVIYKVLDGHVRPVHDRADASECPASATAGRVPTAAETHAEHAEMR